MLLLKKKEKRDGWQLRRTVSDDDDNTLNLLTASAEGVREEDTVGGDVACGRWRTVRGGGYPVSIWWTWPFWVDEEYVWRCVLADVRRA